MIYFYIYINNIQLTLIRKPSSTAFFVWTNNYKLKFLVLEKSWLEDFKKINKVDFEKGRHKTSCTCIQVQMSGFGKMDISSKTFSRGIQLKILSSGPIFR